MTVPVRPFTGAPAGFPGQNGQQQPHPTVGNLGLPGGQAPQGSVVPQGFQQVPAPQQSQQLSYAPQQMQQANPAQSLPQGIPQTPQPQQQHPTIPLNPQPQPQGQMQGWQGMPPQPPANQAPQQPQSPQFQTPQGQRFEVPDNAILDGPNVPPELRGRSWGQVRQLYSALSTQFLAGRQQQQNQQQPESQPQQQAPQQPQGGRPAGPQQGGFWSDPEATIARVVDQRINSALAPIQQQTAQQQAEQAMRVAASGISDWQTLWPEIIQVVSESNADPRALGNPAVWSNAADLARGRLAGRGQYQTGVVQAPAQVQRGPGSWVPAQMAPPMGGMFTEAPTPPQNQFGQPQQNNTLTPEEQFYAQKSGMSNEEYVAWRNQITRIR